MSQEQKHERDYLYKYLAECVLAMFQKRPELLKAMEIAAKYVGMVEKLWERMADLEKEVRRIGVKNDYGEATYLVFVDGRLLSSDEYKAERDIIKDKVMVYFTNKFLAKVGGTRTIRVVRVRNIEDQEQVADVDQMLLKYDESVSEGEG